MQTIRNIPEPPRVTSGTAINPENVGQWCSQDIAVARTQHGHTTFVQTSAQRGVWGHPPPENLGILQPPRSVLKPYTVAKCKQTHVI